MFSAVISLVIYRKYFTNFQEQELLLLFGYLLRSISWFLFIFVANIYSIIVIQSIIGVGQAFSSHSFDSLMNKNMNGKRVSQNYTDWQIIQHLVIAVYSIVGGIVVNMWGFDVIFIIMSLLSLSISIYIYFLPRDFIK